MSISASICLLCISLVWYMSHPQKNSSIIANSYSLTALLPKSERRQIVWLGVGFSNESMMGECHTILYALFSIAWRKSRTPTQYRGDPYLYCYWSEWLKERSMQMALLSSGLHLLLTFSWWRTCPVSTTLPKPTKPPLSIKGSSDRVQENTGNIQELVAFCIRWGPELVCIHDLELRWGLALSTYSDRVAKCKERDGLWQPSSIRTK